MVLFGGAEDDGGNGDKLVAIGFGDGNTVMPEVQGGKRGRRGFVIPLLPADDKFVEVRCL